MLTVRILAHITLDGLLRAPGTVVSVPTRIARNLVASGYATYDLVNPPSVVFVENVVVLNPIEAVPAGLPTGTVILRRPV